MCTDLHRVWVCQDGGSLAPMPALSLVHNMVSCPRSLSHPKEGVKQDVMASKEFTLRPGGVQE